MAMTFRKTLLAATLLAIPAVAQAQGWDPRVRGFYVGAGGGANYLHGTDDSRTASSAEGTDGLRTSTDWGYAAVLSVGYGFGNGLRLEVEGSYRQNDAARLGARGDVFGVPYNFNWNRVSGNVSSYGVMANVLYDFNLGPVAPYVGVGAGYMWQNYDNFRGSDGAPDSFDLLDDTSGAFAYQAILGAAFPIQSVPGLAITAEYRFMGTLGHEISGRFVDGGVTQFNHKYDADSYNHSLLVGVRYNFGRTAAPVAAAAAAPAPARTFLVFFDWNRADLTARARQIIGEAAQARTRQATTRIEVNGHTDTSGSARYNQGLSERRAAAVAAELVRLGVPRNEIVTRGFGQSQLLVATPDNTREPQNRRVEIVLR